jgi:hypothetical protein
MNNFPSHNKDAWIQRVLKELPIDSSLTSVSIENELYSHDGFSTQRSQIVEGHIHTESWKITAEIADLNNKTALAALENGAECLFFNITDYTNLEDLLLNIRLDYIESIFNFGQCSTSKSEELNQYLKENYPKDDYVNYNIDENYGNTTLIECGSLEALNDLITLCIKVHDLIQVNNKSVIIKYEISKNFYTEVSKIRALKVIFANFCEAFGAKNQVKFFAKPQSSTEDINQLLIKWSFEGLSSVIGGVDFIGFKPWDKNFLNEARLAQNLQHLYKEESSLHLYDDAMAGSYFIEETTNQIIAKIWSGLIERLSFEE